MWSTPPNRILFPQRNWYRILLGLENVPGTACEHDMATASWKLTLIMKKGVRVVNINGSIEVCYGGEKTDLKW